MTLYRHLLKEALPLLLFALAFLTAVYLFGFFYAGARWLEGVPLVKVLRWLSYHVPGVLVQVFPIALVTATVLLFGRLAAEGAHFALLSGGIPSPLPGGLASSGDRGGFLLGLPLPPGVRGPRGQQPGAGGLVRRDPHPGGGPLPPQGDADPHRPGEKPLLPGL